MIRSLRFILILALALSSCAKLGLPAIPAKKEAAGPFGPTGIPPQLRGNGPADPGTPVVAGGNAAPKPLPLNLPPDEDMVFTNPDNPDENITELDAVLETTKRGPWEASEKVAKQRAAREGKPLLIWFTDSARSPMCKAISQELFSTNDFGKWADENLVRLRVDSNVEETNPDLDLSTKETRLIDKANYVAALKKRYKILGYPSLILLNPSGEVIGRYRGYKRGDADYTWGLIKHGEAVSDAAYKSWRAGLEKKRYRDWSDRKGRKIFAKLVSYSKGTLVLIEPDGSRAQTKETSLCDADRGWITEQKKLRNIQ